MFEWIFLHPAVLNKKEDDAMHVDEKDTGFQLPFLKVNPKLKP